MGLNEKRIITEQEFKELLSKFFNNEPYTIPDVDFKFGTDEWSNGTYNTHFGCANGCWNCYAWCGACRRKQTGHDLYGRDEDGNSMMALRPKWFKTWQDRAEKYVIMYPSVHDVFEDTMKEAFKIMESMLKAKNVHILWVTKPIYEVVREFMERFQDYKDRITIRLTITTNDNDQLEFWEPYASSYEERYICLDFLYAAGYNVGVSREPMLPSKRRDTTFLEAELAFIDEILPFIRDTLWLGLMNHIPVNVQRGQPLTQKQKQRIADVKAFYTPSNILILVETLYQNPKVRWKESIKKFMLQQMIKSQ
jgi:hypothetical protein